MCSRSHAQGSLAQLIVGFFFHGVYFSSVEERFVKFVNKTKVGKQANALKDKITIQIDFMDV